MQQDKPRRAAASLPRTPRRGVQMLVAASVGALLSSVVVAGSASAADACAPLTSEVSISALRTYVTCRLDGQDARIADLEEEVAALKAQESTPSPSPATSSGASVSPRPVPTVSPTQEPTVAPAPSTAAPVPGATPNFSLTALDGGLSYYGKWSKNTLPTASSFFPVGVWMEQGERSDELAAAGINVNVNPVSPATSKSIYDISALEDEADMWAGPGDGAWTGNFPGQGTVCAADDDCGFTIMKQHQTSVQPGEMRYANYGKGVAFWESEADASRFVNDFQDVTSVDLYWGTDSDLCQASQGGDILGTGASLSSAECHKPANYGRTVDRVRKLASNSKPIWNYVELGHPGSSGSNMPVDEIKPAVWSSLIHGARGIVYFNHSFGGDCQTQHVLQDCDPAIAKTVAATNAEIKLLAPALNSPSVNGVKTTGDIDQLTKFDGSSVWVLTGSSKASGSTGGSVSVPGVDDGTAEVVGESRTVRVVDGTISDTWASPNAVHTYKIDGV